MHKLYQLFKIQFAAAMLPDSTKKRKDGTPKPPNPARSIILWVIMAVLAAAYSFTTCDLLNMSGQPLSVMPCVNIVAASVFMLFTTTYKANSLLFGFKDYDLVMSLPIPAAGIISVRLLIIYLYNLYYMLMILLPTGIVYAVYAHPPALYWPVLISLCLLAPMAPVVIASYIGTLVAYISSFFKKNSAVALASMLAMFFGWLYFSQNSGEFMQRMAQNGQRVLDGITRYYPPAGWFTDALCGLNANALLLFAALSIGLWAAFCAIVGKNFNAINAWVTSRHTSSDFKMGSLNAATPQKALFYRELKRFTSSATYMMNAGIGVVMALAMTIFMAIAPERTLPDLDKLHALPDAVAYMAPVLICFCLQLVLTTACSISLENGSLWIVKSLPVKTMDILNAKLKVNLVLTLPVAVVCSTVFAVTQKPSVPGLFVLYALPVACALFTAVFGQYMNLKYPVFDWDSEVLVITRGKAVGISATLPIFVTIIVGALMFAVGVSVTFVYTAALFALAWYFYRRIKTKGVEMFEGYE